MKCLVIEDAMVEVATERRDKDHIAGRAGRQAIGAVVVVMLRAYTRNE